MVQKAKNTRASKNASDVLVRYSRLRLRVWLRYQILNVSEGDILKTYRQILCVMQAQILSETTYF